MGKIIIEKIVERELGKLYYIDGDGNLCEADLNRGRNKKQKNKRDYQTKEEKEEKEKEMQF